jgi:hypothetical protein
MLAHTVLMLGPLAAAACTGEIIGSGGGGGGGDDQGGDDTGGDDAPPEDDGGLPVFIDAPPADEPPGLEGTTAAHNQVRAAHGVPPLVWDPSLAATAQAWAEQCVDQTAPIGLVDHNPDRSDGHPQYVGENIYGSGGSATGTAAVALWVSEEADYDYDSNTCSDVCGHYTQVVWATTTAVGCGLHDCDGLSFGSTVVCNYMPGGNNGDRPY